MKYREIEFYNSNKIPNNAIEQIVFEKAAELKTSNQKLKAESLLKILPQSDNLNEFFMEYINEYNSLFRFLDLDSFITVLNKVRNKRLMEFKYTLNKEYLTRHIDNKDKEMQFFHLLMEILNSQLESENMGFPRSFIIKELIEFIDSDKFKNKMNPII